MQENLKQKLKELGPLKIGLVLISYIFILYHLSDILKGVNWVFTLLTPFIFGFVIAYLINPLIILICKIYKKIVKKNMRVSVSLIIGYILVSILCIVLCVNIFPQIGNSLNTLIKETPTALESGYYWLETEGGVLLSKFTNNTVVMQDILDLFTDSLEPLYTHFTEYITQIVTATLNLTTFVFNACMGLLISIYMLAKKDTYKGQAKKALYAFLKDDVAKKVITFFNTVHITFSRFIDAKIVDSTIIGVLCYIGCLLFGFDNPVLISFIVGITNIIPYFGPFIGGIVCGLIVFLQGPVEMLGFIMFIIVLQQFDGNILGPKLLGDSLGLTSMWILFAVVLMTGIFGLVGMFIGVPLFTVIYMVIREIIYNQLRKKGKSLETQDYIDKLE